MAEYYLVSQLPSLDGIGEDKDLPITEERFLELCGSFLGKSGQKCLDTLTLLPPKDAEKSGSPLIDKWNEGERNLRFALCKVRAEKMKKTFDIQNKVLPVEMIKLANQAVETESPLEAEKLLNAYRLGFLEALRPMDSFSLDYVYYYGLKLKLLSRMRKLDANKGEAAYKNIYNSIVNGDKLEAI